MVIISDVPIFRIFTVSCRRPPDCRRFKSGSGHSSTGKVSWSTQKVHVLNQERIRQGNEGGWALPYICCAQYPKVTNGRTDKWTDY